MVSDSNNFTRLGRLVATRLKLSLCLYNFISTLKSILVLWVLGHSSFTLFALQFYRQWHSDSCCHQSWWPRWYDSLFVLHSFVILFHLFYIPLFIFLFSEIKGNQPTKLYTSTFLDFFVIRLAPDQLTIAICAHEYTVHARECNTVASEPDPCSYRQYSMLISEKACERIKLVELKPWQNTI